MSEKVVLAIYDITQGMAKGLSKAIIGKQIDAVYHTSLIVYGKEYYFGGGICKDQPEQTPFGKPIEKKQLGNTELPRQIFQDFLDDAAHKYTPQKYHVIQHNCNNFTDQAAEFLVGQGIPKYILNQADQILSTPMGQMFKPMLLSMQGSIRDGQGFGGQGFGGQGFGGQGFGGQGFGGQGFGGQGFGGQGFGGQGFGGQGFGGQGFNGGQNKGGSK